MYVQNPDHLRMISQSKPSGCFLCANPIQLPCIYWMGELEGADVWLHPDCAASLVIRLARDVEEHKLRSKKDLKFV